MSVSSTSYKPFPSYWDVFQKLQTGTTVTYGIHLETDEDFGEVREEGTTTKVGDVSIEGFPTRDEGAATFASALTAPSSGRLVVTIAEQGTITFVITTTSGTTMAKEHYLTILGGSDAFAKKRGFGTLTFTNATDGTLEFTHYPL
jgi:hypothetical protein